MLVTMYKYGKEIKCNPSHDSMKELEKFGWSRNKPKKKAKVQQKD